MVGHKVTLPAPFSVWDDSYDEICDVYVGGQQLFTWDPHDVGYSYWKSMDRAKLRTFLI